jgi:hypothetical protein
MSGANSTSWFRSWKFNIHFRNSENFSLRLGFDDVKFDCSSRVSRREAGFYDGR